MTTYVKISCSICEICYNRRIYFVDSNNKEVERTYYVTVSMKEDYQRTMDEQKRSSRAGNGGVGINSREKDKRL